MKTIEAIEFVEKHFSRKYKDLKQIQKYRNSSVHFGLIDFSIYSGADLYWSGDGNVDYCMHRIYQALNELLHRENI